MVICLFRDRRNAGASLESLAQLAIQVGHHRGARGSPMPIAWALISMSSEYDERTTHDPYPDQFPRFPARIRSRDLRSNCWRRTTATARNQPDSFRKLHLPGGSGRTWFGADRSEERRVGK